MSSISEKRERCRNLQAQLASIKQEEPNPGEVTGALASELDPLADLYTSLIERLPRILELTNNVPISELNKEEVYQSASAQVLMMTQMSFRSVPMAKEALVQMQTVAETARVADLWTSYQVAPQLVLDYLGPTIVMPKGTPPAALTENPKFNELAQVVMQRKADLDAMLGAAKHRHEMKCRLLHAHQAMHVPMGTIGDRSMLATRAPPSSSAPASCGAPTVDVQFTQSLASGALLGYAVSLKDLEDVVGFVGPHISSLHYAPDLLRMAERTQEVATLLGYYCECLRLCSSIVNSSDRLGQKWMPVDVQPTICALVRMEVEIYERRCGGGDAATFVNLLKHQDAIVTALCTLREAEGAVELLRRDVLVTFPRLSHLPMDVVECMIGGVAHGGAATNDIFNGVVRTTCFHGWKRFIYSNNTSSENKMQAIYAVESSSGEVLNFLEPVSCSREVRADVCLARVVVAVQAAVYAQLERGAKHSHQVVVGSSTFQVKEILGMTYQCARFALAVLWTSMCEGSFVRPNGTGGGGGGAPLQLHQTTDAHTNQQTAGESFVSTSTRPPSRSGTAATPLSPNQSLLQQSLSSSAKWAMTSSSRPESSAKQRVEAVTRVPDPKLISMLEPRLGSASPNIFKKPKDANNNAAAGAKNVKKGALTNSSSIASFGGDVRCASSVALPALSLTMDDNATTDDLQSYLGSDDLKAQQMLPCITRDRVLSCVHKSEDVVPILWAILKELVSEKHQARCRAMLSEDGDPDGASVGNTTPSPPQWWFDRLSEFVYQLARTFQTRVRFLTVHDPAWHREPRAYFSRGKALFELGPMVFENELEFSGGAHVPFVLSPLLHETWCKLSTGLLCQESLRPTCLIGDDVVVDNREHNDAQQQQQQTTLTRSSWRQKVFLIRALMAHAGRFASSFVCSRSTLLEPILDFVLQQTGFVGSLAVVCDVHMLSIPVQIQLAQELEACEKYGGGGAPKRCLTAHNGELPPQGGGGEPAKRIHWDLVVFTGGSSPLDCHSSLQARVRCCYVPVVPCADDSEEEEALMAPVAEDRSTSHHNEGTRNATAHGSQDDDVGLVLEAWMASNGFPVDDIPIMAQRLLVMSSLMLSICRVVMDQACIHRAIIAAGVALRRDSSSSTADAALLHSIRQELAPTQLPQHKDFFDVIGRGLFASEANTVFFPQVVEAAKAAIEREGLAIALDVLAPTILQLHQAFSSAVLSGSTVCIVGPSCSGKSTVVRIVRDVCATVARNEGEGDDAAPVVKQLCAVHHRDAQAVSMLVRGWLGLTPTCPLSSGSIHLWLSVRGVLSPAVQAAVTRAIEDHKRASQLHIATKVRSVVVVVEADVADAPAVTSWPRSILVPVLQPTSHSPSSAAPLDAASPIMWFHTLKRMLALCLPAALQEMIDHNDMVTRMFTDHFEDALQFSFASRLDGAVVIPLSRMTQNTIILFVELLLLWWQHQQQQEGQRERSAQQRSASTVDSTPLPPSLPRITSDQLERVFWFSCTWGMESNKERSGWDAFVSSRVSSVHAHDATDASIQCMPAHRRSVSPMQSRPSSRPSSSGALLVSPFRSRCVSPVMSPESADGELYQMVSQQQQQQHGAPRSASLSPPQDASSFLACGLTLPNLTWAPWAAAGSSLMPALLGRAVLSANSAWRSLWQSPTSISVIVVSSLYLRHRRHHHVAQHGSFCAANGPLPPSVASPPTVAICGPSGTAKTLMATILAQSEAVDDSEPNHNNAGHHHAQSTHRRFSLISTRNADSACMGHIYRSVIGGASSLSPLGGDAPGETVILDGEHNNPSVGSRSTSHEILLSNVLACSTCTCGGDESCSEGANKGRAAGRSSPPPPVPIHSSSLVKNCKRMIIVSRASDPLATWCPTVFTRCEQLLDHIGDASHAASTFGEKVGECLRPLAQVGGVLYRHVPLYRFTLSRRWASANSVLRLLNDASHPTTAFYALLHQHWSTCCHDSREVNSLDQLLLQIFGVIDASNNVVLHDDEQGEPIPMHEGQATHLLKEAAAVAVGPQHGVAGGTAQALNAQQQRPIPALVTPTSVRRIAAMYCAFASTAAGGLWLASPTSWKSVTSVVNVAAAEECKIDEVPLDTSAEEADEQTAPTSTTPTKVSTTPTNGEGPSTNSSKPPTGPATMTITTNDVKVVGDVFGELSIVCHLLHVDLVYVTQPPLPLVDDASTVGDMNDSANGGVHVGSRPGSASLHQKPQRHGSGLLGASTTSSVAISLGGGNASSVTSVRLPTSVADAMRSAQSNSSVYLIPIDEVRTSEDSSAIEHAMLRGVRVAFDAVRSDAMNSKVPQERLLLDPLEAMCHPVVMRTTLADVQAIVGGVMDDKETARAISKLLSAAARASNTPPSTRDVLYAVRGVETARTEMERSLDERISRCSSVIKFLRRVELAIAGKSLIPAAEQQFEVREETSNRALTGTIVFTHVPAKSVRLIAQFTVNYEEGRLQEVSGPSVFFGTTREDVVAIPAVNGGTCRARLDTKVGGVIITTGVLDFQLTVLQCQPLTLEGTVTDPATGHAVVGAVRLQQVIEEENVYNKNWLRFGPSIKGNDASSTPDTYAMSRPESVPGEEELEMNRIDTDRYITRVGSMCKALQTQLEQMVLQKVFQERNDTPKLLAGQTMVDALLPLTLEERDRVVTETHGTALVSMESPLTLRGLAALLQLNVYEVEMWLIQERSRGLPYGYLAEQNACALRHCIARQRQYKASIKERGGGGGGGDDDEDEGSAAARPIVVLDEDDTMIAWVLDYCARSADVVVHRGRSTQATTDDHSAADERSTTKDAAEKVADDNPVGSISSSAPPTPRPRESFSVDPHAEDEDVVRVFITPNDALSAADRSAATVLSTVHTKGSLTSLYQMQIARPARGSNTELTVRASIQAAIDAQHTLTESLAALLSFLHTQFALSEDSSSLVLAIIEMGKERVPGLMDAIRLTKDLLAAADAYVDRSGSRWTSIMENALPHAKRVALLHTSTLQILPSLSPSYGFSDAFAASVASNALSVSGKGVVEAETKVFVTQVLRMVRLEHRLTLGVCLAALIACSGDAATDGGKGTGSASASRAKSGGTKRPTSAPQETKPITAAMLSTSGSGASLLGASEFSFLETTESDPMPTGEGPANGVPPATPQLHPFLLAMRAIRTADVRTHIQRERQLKASAVSDFESYKNQLALLPPPTTAKAKAAAAKVPKKELKDFLSPAIKPPFPFLTYGTWVKVLALTDSIPSLCSLAANMQFADAPTPGTGGSKGGVTAALRQDKWAEWAHNPNITSVPTYEKDTSVTPLDKMLLVHVLRPERTSAAALQFVADVLGNEIPDPLSFDDVPQFLASVSTTTSTAILYRPAQPVSLLDTLSAAAFMRVRQSQTKRRESTAGNPSDAMRALVRNSGHHVVVRLSVEGMRLRNADDNHSWDAAFAIALANAVQRNQWVLVDDVEEDAVSQEEQGPPNTPLLAALIQDALDQCPEYAGMIVVVLNVDSASCTTARHLSMAKTGNGGRHAASVLATAWPRVSCGEPASVRAQLRRMYEGGNRFHGERLYRALASEADGGEEEQQREGNNSSSIAHRNTFLVSFLVAAVSQRCRYAHVAFSEPEKIANIDADVHAATTFLLRRRIPAHSTKHWDEVRNLTRDVVGASIRDPRDKSVVMAMIDWLIHPDVVSEDHLGFLQLPGASTLDAHLNAIDQLSSVDAAEHLGFHANEERLVCEREGRMLMSIVGRAIFASTSGAPQTSASSAVAAVAMQLEAHSVPATWSSSDLLSVRSAMVEFGTALSKVLQQEVDALHHILESIHEDLRLACTLDPSTTQRLEALLSGSTPSHWLSWTHGAVALPHRAEALTVWLESLRSRNHQLLEWARQGLPRILALGCLSAPLGFMHAFVFDACREMDVGVTQYHAQLTVVPPAEAQSLPELHQSNVDLYREGMYFVGFTLEGGALNPTTGSIEDPPDFISEWWREPKVMVPLVHLSVVKHPNATSMWGSQRSSSGLVERSGADFLTGRAARIQDAINFSRSNATIVKQRPSSAMGNSSCCPPVMHAALAPLGGSALTGTDDDAEHQRSQSAMDVFTPSSPADVSSFLLSTSHHRRDAWQFRCPLYHSSLRTQESYVCDVVLASRQEHNYWLIRGAALICEP